MKIKWRCTLKIHPQGAFFTLGPGRTLPWIDRMLQVDTEGFPMIPASSVRGRVRAHLERLLNSQGKPVCTPPIPEQTCPHNDTVEDSSENGMKFCMACRIFGSTWRETSVFFSDFHMDRGTAGANEVIAERPSVTISRNLGSAQAERLFVTQTTDPVCRGPLIGRVEGHLTREELGWLISAVRFVTHLGGSKARGLGNMSLKVENLEQWDAEYKKWVPLEAGEIVEEAVAR